jgi:hypothetical protein
MEKVFNYFKWMWDEEELRGRGLKELGKTYLSLVTLYSGFALFAAKDTNPAGPLEAIVFAGAITSLLIAFLLTLVALSVAGYEAPNDPEGVLESLGEEEEVDEDAFHEARVADFHVAIDRNSVVNDKEANALSNAGYFLLIGITLHAVYFLLTVFFR